MTYRIQDGQKEISNYVRSVWICVTQQGVERIIRGLTEFRATKDRNWRAINAYVLKGNDAQKKSLCSQAPPRPI